MSFRRSKIPKPISLISLIILIILIPLAISFLQTPGGVEAAWVDDNFSYRNAIPITSHTSAENNVYVSATIDTSASGQFQADCGDLRFTTVGGDILPYYIVSGCVSASTVVHVFFKSMPAGAQTIYYYYGNPSAANGFSSSDFATVATSYAVGTVASQEKGGAPIAYWKFDDGTGTNTQDSSPNNNDGTITGATWKTESDCLSGKCLYYDGTGDYVTVADSAIDTSGAHSYSVWAKPITLVADHAIMGDFNGNTQGTMLFVSSSNNNLCAYVDSTLKICTTSVSLNTWHHFALVDDNTNISFYVDSRLIGTTTSTTSDGGSMYIGTYNGRSQSSFDGLIDEPKIYNYARTAAQVKSDFKSRGTAKGTSVVAGSSRQNSDALSNGLIGYWKMDEVSGAGSILADSSGNSNTGTAVLWGGGNTSTDSAHVAGKFGNSFSFDGGDDYINLGDISAFDFGLTTSYTLSAWIKTSVTGTNNIVSKYNGNGIWEFKTNSSGKIALLVRGSDGANIVTIAGNTIVTDNSWHHVLAVRDYLTRTIYIYKDGVLDGSGVESLTAGMGSVGTAAIGARYQNSVSITQFFTGTIDEVRIYNRALSPREVRDLYAFAPGPIGYWNLDEKSGQTVNDISGNGSSGTLGANSSVASDDPSWSDGKYGGGLSFNSSNSTYVNVANTTTLSAISNKNFSFGAWIKINGATGTYQMPLAKKTGGSASAVFDLETPSNGTANYTFYIGDGTIANNTGQTPFNFGEWTYVSGTSDGSKIRLYVNGVLRKEASITISDWTNTQPIQIGGPTYPTNGQIDDVRIYNYARTQKQIVEDMNAGHPTGGSPVGSQIGYWKMDEGYGTTTNDSGPNNMIGTLLNTPGWSNNGKFGKAIDLPGTNQWVRVNDNSALDMTGPFTISAWINRRGSYSNQEFISKVTYGTNQREYELAIGTSNALRVGFTTDGTAGTWKTCTGTTVIPQNQWTHVLGLYDGTYLRVYINGKPDTPCNIGSFTVFSGTSNLSIGQHGTDGASYFNGILDEIKIYNSALTEDEIKLDYNRGQAMVLGTLSDTSGLTGGSIASSSASALYCVPGDTTTCNPPLAEWSLDEGSGNSVNDVSGNGYTGTWNGSSNHWVDGIIGKAGNFSTANGDYVGLGTTTSLTPTSLVTAEAWIYPTRFPTQASERMGIIGRNYRTPWQMSLWESGQVYWGYTMSDGTSFDYKAVGAPLTLNQWNFVAITHNVSTGQLISYINGKQTTYTAIYTGTLVTPSGTATIGSSGGSSQIFQGKIDRPRIFDYVRTAAQVAWDYNQGKPIAQWKLDECQGASVFDASGNGNTGTITIGGTGTQTAVGTCTTSGTAWYNGVTGKFNSSINLDGTDDRITTTLTTPLANSSFTISGWVYASSIPSDKVWLSVGSSQTANNSIHLRVYNDLKIRMGFHSNDLTTATNAFTLGAWNHLTYTYNYADNKRYIYKNGLQIATDTASSPFLGNTSAYIGAWVSGEYWPGQIDDVKIFNYALTATQVKSLYNGGSAIRFGPVTGSP